MITQLHKLRIFLEKGNRYRINSIATSIQW